MATIAPVIPITRQPAPGNRYAAYTIARISLRCATTQARAAQTVRSLFAGCAEAGYGFPDECQATVMAELTALANGAP